MDGESELNLFFMLYFGTSTTQYGHYIWELTGGLYRSQISYDDIPFNPYEHKNNPKGHSVFVQAETYTALHIAGSCKDERGGTVSVFWVNGSYSPADFIAMIKSNKAAMQIIEAMPFDVEI